MSEKMYAEEELVREVRAANIVRGKWFALLAKHIPAEIFDEAAKKACWEFGLSRKEAAGGAQGLFLPPLPQAPQEKAVAGGYPSHSRISS